MKLKYFLLSLLLIFIASPSFSDDLPLIDFTDKKYLNISGKIDILEDPAKKWTIDDVISHPVNSMFKSLSGDYPSFGFTGSRYWARFRLIDQTSAVENIFIENFYPMTDYIGMYVFDKNKTLIHTAYTGRSYPSESREISHRNFIFKITGSKDPLDYTVYLEFESKSAMNIFLSLWKESEFIKKHSKSYTIYGIIYGAMLVMILYNLFLFISIRDKSNLYYSFYYSSFLMFQVSINGIAAQYFWPGAVLPSYISIPVFVFLSIIFSIQFAKSFLNMKKYLPSANKILSSYQGAAFLILPGVFFVPYSMLIIIAGIIIVMTAVTLWVSSFILAYRGNRQAVFYIIAWTIFLTASILFVLQLFTVISSIYILKWGLAAGSMTEMVLISLGLADRINYMRKNYENLSRDLEEKVSLRTRDLNFLVKDMQQKEKEIEKEFELAGDIQKGILPSTPYYIDGIRVEGFYKSMFKVGGDFYDIFPMKGGYTGILIADASGHGMPAAFITALAKISFSEAVQNSLFPVDIFKQVNRELLDTIITDDFITAFLIVISPSFEVLYGNASHQMAIVYRKNKNTIEEWDTDGLFLGALEEANDMYEEKTDMLDYGDRILLYSDGLSDSLDTAENPYSEKRLRQLLKETADLSLAEAKQAIIDDWMKHSGSSPQLDDITFLLVEIDPMYKVLIEKRDDGFKNLSMGKYDKAIEQLEIALEINPEDETSHLYLGECYLYKKEYAEAVPHLHFFVNKNEYDANVWLHLAEALFNTGDYANALNAARKGYNLKSDFIEAIRIGARSLTKMGREHEAQSLLSRINSIKSSYEDTGKPETETGYEKEKDKK